MKEPAERYISLVKKGRNLTLRMPQGFVMPGDEVIVRQEGNRLIIEQVKKRSLLRLLSTWQPSDEAFPDVDQGLPPLADVEVS